MSEEKTFQHFLELPAELRMMFIDKMEPDVRCRFSGCSKLSNKEAVNSKNYIYSLELYCDESFKRICISHTAQKYDYYLTFTENLDEKTMECSNDARGALWEVKLDNSTDLIEYTAACLRAKLQKYKNSVKRLGVEWEFENFDFEVEVEHFNNLEELEVIGDVDIQQFLSKTRHPLKKLVHCQVKTQKINGDCEQIYQVKDCLVIPYLKLNNEKFEQLSADWVSIDIGYLTEQDIFNIVRSWQNGTKRVDYFEWDIEDSSFNVPQLFELLDAPKHELSERELIINHYKEAGKVARLVWFDVSRRKIIFVVQ